MIRACREFRNEQESATYARTLLTDSRQACTNHRCGDEAQQQASNCTPRRKSCWS